MSTDNQVFTRLQPPLPEMQQVVSDIYDRIAALTQDTTTPSVTPVTPVTPGTTVINISGASGTAAGPQLAFIPKLVTLPSNNPTVGAPYAQNGLLIEVNDQLWRYSGAPVYQWQQAGTATTILTDTHANRVLSFPAASYPNALFLESDTLVLLVSNSSLWETIAGQVEDSHANRLSTWPSVQYSPGTVFYETDRTVKYVVENAVGTVTVAGGVNVTWTAGNHFINTGTGFTAAQWPVNTPIVIAGLSYAVSVVNSATSLTLVSAAVNGAAQAYTVASGRWVYSEGEYAAALASLPTDLGENDTTLVSTKVAFGFLFYENAAYAHQLQWNVSAWQRGPHDRDHSDTFHEFGAVPTDIGWQACDGSTIAYLKYDGTTANRTVPNTNGTAAYYKGGGSYSPTLVAPQAPTLTPAGTVSAPSFTGDEDSGVDVQSGTGATVVGAPYTPSGSVSAPTFTGTANQATTLPGDPVENVAVIKMYRR